MEPERLANGRIVTGRTGAGPGDLSQPGDVFVDRNGAIWVADGRNNRITRYDAQGNYLGNLSLPGAPGPQPFNEPWSVAVDEQGFIYVADTWNHRIVKFSPWLQFVTTWGRPAAQTTPPGLLDLFGPRDIMIGEDGSILVTDTGHNRLITYTRDGQPISEYGLQGTANGRFQEPVSVARDIQGRLYVADAWNGRIQRFERGFTGEPASAAVPWRSREVPDKPYIAILSEGRVLVTVPENGTLMLFDADLRPIGTWRPEAGAKPIGVAPTADGGFVFSDSAHDQVQIVPGAKVAELFK
jgi:DNA-binding beta-propeller fold protein YncE